MKPRSEHITLNTDILKVKTMLKELFLQPRINLAKWAEITKQTPNLRIGYPGQHLASLVTGVEGERTGARGHDLRDKSEVKSCSRVDQLDKCRNCRASVARIEPRCPECLSDNIKRNNDSKWLFAIRNENELNFLLDEVPRIVLIISDYPEYESEDWGTLRFQVFEIWPSNKRHENFRTLMENYFRNIYLPHIRNNPNRTPAPKNFWPYSFQFYMCNPVQTFHCIVRNALSDPEFEDVSYIEPSIDRQTINPLPMPLSILNDNERQAIERHLGEQFYSDVEIKDLDSMQRLLLPLRNTDFANPQNRLYRRGDR